MLNDKATKLPNDIGRWISGEFSAGTSGQILFSPQIAKYVTSIRTIREFQFPRHHPIVVECRLDAVQDHFTSWISPMPFSEEQMKHLGDDQFNDIFIDFLHHGDLDPESPNGCTFEDWSLAVERAVHKTLLLKSAKGLKAMQRGRGQPPRYKQFQFEFGAKIARNVTLHPALTLQAPITSRWCDKLAALKVSSACFGNLESMKLRPLRGTSSEKPCASPWIARQSRHLSADVSVKIRRNDTETMPNRCLSDSLEVIH